MRARETSGTRPADRELWRRSQETDAAPDEAEQLLDLAAFADNRLDDDDETTRIAELVARDGDAAADVAAAQVLDGVTAADDQGAHRRDVERGAEARSEG